MRGHRKTCVLCERVTGLPDRPCLVCFLDTQNLFTLMDNAIMQYVTHMQQLIRRFSSSPGNFHQDKDTYDPDDSLERN